MKPYNVITAGERFRGLPRGLRPVIRRHISDENSKGEYGGVNLVSLKTHRVFDPCLFRTEIKDLEQGFLRRALRLNKLRPKLIHYN